MTKNSGLLRRLQRHPLVWVALAVILEMLLLIPNLDTLGDESKLSVLMQWQNGPFLLLLFGVGLISELLFVKDKALGWAASILIPFGLFQFRHFVYLLVFFHPVWLVGVASMICVFVASIKALFGPVGSASAVSRKAQS